VQYSIKSVVCVLQGGGAEDTDVTLRVRATDINGSVQESATANNSSFGLSTTLSSGTALSVTLENTDSGNAKAVGYNVEIEEL
jgi:hypothetical protein